MANYAPQLVTSSGITMTFNTSAAGDRVPPGVMLLVKNTTGGGITVSLVTQDTADGNLAVTDRQSISVPATTGLVPIRVPTSDVYRDPADGLVGLVWSAPGAGVTFAVLT